MIILEYIASWLSFVKIILKHFEFLITLNRTQCHTQPNSCSFYIFQVHSILMVALWEESTKFTLLPLKQSWTLVVLNCPNAWMTNISTVNSWRSPDTQKEKSLTPKRRHVLYCSSSFFLLYVGKKITFELKNAKCLTLCRCSLLSVGVKLYWNSSLSLHVFLIVHNS